MPNLIQNLQQKTDAFLTDYLRDTTTDQEILDFYGEGNIIGRKGILDTPGAVILEVSKDYNLPGKRPNVKREIIEADLTGLSGGETKVLNLEGSIDPSTKNPWQMKFETLPFPGGGIPTTAAQRFLKDFRVPIGNTVDYGFETSPNVIDLNTKQITKLTNTPSSYVNSGAAFLAEAAGTPLSDSGPLRQSTQEEIERIRARAVPYTRHSGKMLTPSDWEGGKFPLFLEDNFEIPSNLKDETLERFKSEIMQAEKPFGSVSQLTPVIESYDYVRPGGDPAWRANLYEKTGLAGPMTEVSVRGAYGPSTGNVQMFTRGNERLLPIQPYTEFLDKYDASKPSALNTTPAADFTPFQKAIGTRNYLIGRNILEGRGNLGKGFAGGLSVGAADLIPSREIVADFYNNGPVQGLTRFAGDIIGGIPAALITGGAVTAAPVLAPIAAGTGLALTGNRALGAADEIIKRQTGEGILSKVRQAIGTAPRTGVAARPTFMNQPLTAEIRPLSSKEKTNMINRENRNEIQRRIDLAGERFNPRRGEFGLSEILFGR